LIIRVLRLANVYTGKNDQLDRVIPKFIIRAAKNEDLVINGKGKEILDFIEFLKEKAKEESDTEYLSKNKSLKKSIIKGLKTPLSECSDKLDW